MRPNSGPHRKNSWAGRAARPDRCLSLAAAGRAV